MSTIPSYLQLASTIATTVVAKHAAKVDSDGDFPSEAIASLKRSDLLGLMSAPTVGGMGEGAPAAAQVVEIIARECASTAMVLCMHYCGTAVLESSGTEAMRRRAASGDALMTLAFSEAGSRSHFWAPVGTAETQGDGVHLYAHKSWVTAARHADYYVWSSKPSTALGLSTLWLVPRDAKGLDTGGSFDGLGLRGNDSLPVIATDVVVPADHRLGVDGGGFDLMMGVVLPLFNACSAGVSVGLMETAIARAVVHVSGTKHEHMDTSLSQLPTIRNHLARMKCSADAARCLWLDTLAAMVGNRPDTMLRVLECKAFAGDTANEVMDLAMRVCGGAAYRKDVGVERCFRDARAAGVMAPTTDVLYDFIGKAVCGMDLF
jgi:alkylation response protein AidB-like acyl-CoA dehydrogenase